MKKAIKLICCHYKNNKNKNCYKGKLPELLQYVKDSEGKLLNAKEAYDNLVKNIIQINNISAALRLNLKFTEFTYDLTDFYNNNNDKLSKCQYDPKSCTTQFEDSMSRIMTIKTEFDQLKLHYGQINNLIENLNDYYQQSKSKDIYCKFRIDRSDQLMCLVYDFSFEEFNNSSAIFVFYGSQSRTRMYLKYKDFQQLFIIDFKSNRSRQGHGTFVLEELPIIVQEINKRIKQNRYVNIPHTDTITSITGSIVPDSTISKEDLVCFYNKHGYITNNKLYKKVP